jgi:hypothetical protein
MSGRHVVVVTTTKRCLAHGRFSCPSGKEAQAHAAAEFLGEAVGSV